MNTGSVTKLTRVRSRWGAIANPHAKVFYYPPAPTSPTPGHDPGSRMKILFNMFFIFFCENTHIEFGINIFEIDMLMIFDLFTSPQGHQFDPRIKCYLHSVLLIIPVDLICPPSHTQNISDEIFILLPGSCPRSGTLGHDPGNKIKISSDMFCIFHL